MLILVKTPFTEFVPGEGMVVGNMGRIVSLPDNMAQSRIDSGFGEESTQEAFDAQEEADAAELEARELADGEMLAEGEQPTGATVTPRKPRGPNKPRTPKAAKSPVDAPVA